jgi:hypothetical protein
MRAADPAENVSQSCPDDRKGKPNEGLSEGEFGALTFFVAFRVLANPRSLAMNLSSIGAMSWFASTGFLVSLARISAYATKLR